MLEGILDGDLLVVWYNSYEQAFYERTESVLLLPNRAKDVYSPQYELMPGEPTVRRIADHVDTFILPPDIKRLMRDEEVITVSSNRLPKATQYCFIRGEEATVLFHPDVTLTELPRNYLCWSGFDEAKNRVNDNFYRRLQKAIHNSLVTPREIIGEFLDHNEDTVISDEEAEPERIYRRGMRYDPRLGLARRFGAAFAEVSGDAETAKELVLGKVVSLQARAFILEARAEFAISCKYYQLAQELLEQSCEWITTGAKVKKIAQIKLGCYHRLRQSNGLYD